MLQLPKNASEKLTEVESRLRSLREEKARAVKVAEAAKAAAIAVPEGEDDNAQYQAAEQAVAAVKAIQARIEEAQEEQIALLGTAGGPGTWSGMDGWSQIARAIDLEHGDTSVHVPLGSLVAQDGGFGVPTGGSSVATQRVPLAQPAQDNRFLFPSLPQRPLDDGALAVVDFVQTGSRALTGSVERDPLSTADKAELGLAFTAESEDVKQLAVTVTDVPDKLFAAEPSLDGFLREEMAYALRVALDSYVTQTITVATTEHGLTGSTLIEQARHGVRAARANGALPRLLAVSPEDAAELDLSQTGADHAFVFALRDTGSADPLWGLSIREVPSLVDPHLIDPPLAASLYLGRATFSLDPYSGFRRDTVDARLEFETLAHVRDSAGLFRIKAS